MSDQRHAALEAARRFIETPDETVRWVVNPKDARLVARELLAAHAEGERLKHNFRWWSDRLPGEPGPLTSTLDCKVSDSMKGAKTT